MSGPEQILDRALALGEQELDHLEARDVDQASRTAEERFTIMEQVLGIKADPDQKHLMDKLMRLKQLQGRLTAEACKLHAALKEDLARVQMENRRMTGYAGSRPQRPTSVYVNKHG